MTNPKIFYDGYDIAKYAPYPNVVGFTTNPTILRQGNIKNYKQFYESNKEYIANRPISFQVCSTEPEKVLQQAREISSIGQHIYVKIPIVDVNGQSMLQTIQQVLNEGIFVNITAIFTREQILDIFNILQSCTTPFIVSVFGGRISDTGVDPLDILAFAVDTMKPIAGCEILWAGVKDNLVLSKSSAIGCHIVTLPDAIMQRINRIGQSLDNLSVDTVKSFINDAVEGKLTIL